MTRRIMTIFGYAFLVIGLAGFASPGLFGAHLSPAHNLIHLASGILAVYYGTRASLVRARRFCMVFGLLYLALGSAGYLFGGPSVPGLSGTVFDEKLLRVWPGVLELGRADHNLHLFFGAVILLAGLSAKPGQMPPQVKHKEREREPAIR